MPTGARGTLEKQLLRVSFAEIAWLEAGAPGTPPVVLLHGMPTHAYLWRKVLRQLDGEVHLLAPDLMGLGDTLVSPYQDFTAPMQAEVLLEWFDKLDLAEVTLVGHDQGGAVAQQIVSNHPERVSRLLLVNSVAYDNWPVPLVREVMRLARTPGLDVIAYALGLPRRIAHARLGFSRAVYDRRCLPADVIEEYLRPMETLDGRERARRYLLAGDARFTLECVPGLRRFDKPALVAWGADDVFLSPSWGVRLAADLPRAGPLRLIPFCGHLVPEEKPAELGGLIRELLHVDENAVRP